MAEYWENEYKDLLYRYRQRGSEIDKLNEELRKTEDNLSSAEFKINSELNPRIEQENRSYDAWATSPSRGMPEGCMQDCTACKNMECDGYRDYLRDQGYEPVILEDLAGIPWLFKTGVDHVNSLAKELKDFNGRLKTFEILDGSSFSELVRPLTREDIKDGVLCIDKQCANAVVLNITTRNPILNLWYKLYDWYLIKTHNVIKDDWVEMLNDM